MLVKDPPTTGVDWLTRFRKLFTLLRVELDLGGQDAVSMLSFQGGEAVTVADEQGATILFASSEPSASAVLEEVAHVLQHHRKRYADDDVMLMRCQREIEAKQCLLDHGASLRLPESELMTTQHQLAEEQAILEGLRWR